MIKITCFLPISLIQSQCDYHFKEVKLLSLGACFFTIIQITHVGRICNSSKAVLQCGILESLAWNEYLEKFKDAGILALQR